MNPSMLIVMPHYGQCSYTKAAVESFFRHTLWKEAHLMLIDDCYPDWNAVATMAKELRASIANEKRLSFHQMPQNSGVTACWNFGLTIAANKIPSPEYTVLANNDILFTPDWHLGLVEALLEGGFDLVGPVSNAPGITAAGLQEVERYMGYKPGDSEEHLAKVAKILAGYRGEVVVGNPNGFFLMARTKTWWTGSFDAEHVFNPDAQHRMTLNEDELEGRWRKMGRKFGICPSSFILHYRSITRGDRYKKAGWLRRTKS